MRQFLDFEKPIVVLEGKLEELRHMSSDMDINISEEVGRLQLTREIMTAYSSTRPGKGAGGTPSGSPQDVNIIARLFDDFTLAGDRNYAEDHAVIGGLARFAVMPWLSWGLKRATPRKTGSSAISVWPVPKATARRGG